MSDHVNGNTTVSTIDTTGTELTTELSSTDTKESTVYLSLTDTASTLELDEPKKGSQYTVNLVISLCIISLIGGKILIPSLVTVTFALEFVIVDAWIGDYNPIKVAKCNNPSPDVTCQCDGDFSSECKVDLDEANGSFLRFSVALNTMVFVFELLWFIRTLYSCKQNCKLRDGDKFHNNSLLLSVFKAIGKLTRDKKCFSFLWRLFELSWYVVMIFTFHLHQKLNCYCSTDDGGFEWTQKGRYYRASRNLDFAIVSVIFLFVLSKILFLILMSRMMNNSGAYYDMGSFWAVLKIEWMENRMMSLYEDSVSVWSPLKQENIFDDDVKYQSHQLKLHYKGWK